MTWDEPTADVCPQCGSTLFKKGGKNGTLSCQKEGCGFTKSASEAAPQAPEAKDAD
jgi:DNA topoisomerase-1